MCTRVPSLINSAGDYTFDAKSETRLAVFLYPDILSEPSPSRSFDLGISFYESRTPFAAQEYLSRMIEAHTRQSVHHAPLPPEILSIIIRYVVPTSKQTARRRVGKLRLVCSHWNKTLKHILFDSIFIEETRHLESLLQTLRNCSATTSSPGQRIRMLSLDHRWSHDKSALPSLESMLLLGLGTHATQLMKLDWGERAIMHSSGSPRSRPSPPRIMLALPALIRRLSTLHTLELAYRSVDSCAQLFSLIHALPSLKRLKLTNVTVGRIGPVRTEHVSAAMERLQIFHWRFSNDITGNQSAYMAAVAARLCTGNVSHASSIAEAVSRAPWFKTNHRHAVIWYTCKAETAPRPNRTHSSSGRNS